LQYAKNHALIVVIEGGEDWSYNWPTHSELNIQLVQGGDTFSVGNITVTVVHTPGHTPEHICFLIQDANALEPIGYASGDFVFVGDLGRPDLLETVAGFEGVMEASASQLHESCLQFLDMEDYVQVWPAHGAGSACGKAIGAIPQSTVGYEKRTSPPLQLVGDEKKFVEFMLTGLPEPPLYFARMKQMNRDGVPLLGNFPTPKRIMDSKELLSTASGKTVIDTRPWEEVRDGHLPNTIWAQATSDFHRFAGSFVDDAEEIVLIVSEDEYDRAIRNCIRIGLDKLVAWTTPLILSQVEQLETMPEITSTELDQSPEFSVLDVRRSVEHSDGAIDGAINISHTRLLTRLSDIDTEALWVLNCHGGSRSAASCMALKRLGYKVTNLSGGYKGWKANRESCAAST